MFSRRTLRVSIVIATFGLLLGTLSALAAPAQHSSSGVVWFADGSPIPGTSSKLVRNDSGISMTIKTAELPPGSVQTIWWVVFNNTDACDNPLSESIRCSEPDLFNPDVMASVMYAAGHVIGNNGKGNFGGHLSVGDTSGCHFFPIMAGGDVFFPCNPLTDPRGAEIHLVVHDHGPAVPGMIADQLSTFDGGCANLGRGTGPNVCDSIQAAAHSAP